MAVGSTPTGHMTDRRDGSTSITSGSLLTQDSSAVIGGPVPLLHPLTESCTATGGSPGEMQAAAVEPLLPLAVLELGDAVAVKLLPAMPAAQATALPLAPTTLPTSRKAAGVPLALGEGDVDLVGVGVADCTLSTTPSDVIRLKSTECHTWSHCGGGSGVGNSGDACGCGEGLLMPLPVLLPLLLPMLLPLLQLSSRSRRHVPTSRPLPSTRASYRQIALPARAHGRSRSSAVTAMMTVE